MGSYFQRVVEVITRRIFGHKCISVQDFNREFYMNNNPDVRKSGLDPYSHFIKYGKYEGRFGCPLLMKKSLIRISISVVIPTYNRADLLSEVVRKIFECGDGLDMEVIVVNDGSTDNTVSVLNQLDKKFSNFKALSILNQGAGVARNYGASIAKKDIILFIGDDIIPRSPEFLTAHAKYHQENKNINLAILGKVVWPEIRDFEVTPVMNHIQGHGGEQFGYADMQAYKYWDWRFFYTCNVSVKKRIVADWISDGFSPAFSGCGFEDGEFGFRMERKYGFFPVLYITESIGQHYHRHTVRSFNKRQRLAGAMAVVMNNIHPKTISKTGFKDVVKVLKGVRDRDLQNIPVNMAFSENLFAWAESLESRGVLGTEPWHKQLLHCVFRISACLGYMDRAVTPKSNYSGALAYVLESSTKSLRAQLPRLRWKEYGFSDDL